MAAKQPKARRLSQLDKACCAQSVETAVVVAQFDNKQLFQKMFQDITQCKMTLSACQADC